MNQNEDAPGKKQTDGNRTSEKGMHKKFVSFKVFNSPDY